MSTESSSTTEQQVVDVPPHPNPTSAKIMALMREKLVQKCREENEEKLRSSNNPRSVKRDVVDDDESSSSAFRAPSSRTTTTKGTIYSTIVFKNPQDASTERSLISEYVDYNPEAYRISNVDPEEGVPEAEKRRRRQVEQELIELSEKCRAEQLRKERMRPLTWAKARFDPFSSSGDSSDTTTAAVVAPDKVGSSGPSSSSSSASASFSSTAARSSSNSQEESRSSRKRALEDGVPPQAREYYAQSHPIHNGYGFMGMGNVWNHSPEEVEELVKFADKWIPTDPKRKKMIEEEIEKQKKFT